MPVTYSRLPFEGESPKPNLVRHRGLKSRISLTDTTDDVCSLYALICIIQNQTGTVGWSAPGYCNNSPPPTIEYYALDVPNGLTVSFSPNPVSTCPYNTTETIVVSNGETPENYTTYTVAQPSNLPTPTSGGSYADIQVSCSNDLNKCPEIQVINSVTQVILSSPAPTPMSVIGKRNPLAVVWASGSGTGTYNLSNPSWNIHGEIVGGYDFADGATPIPANPTPSSSTIAFYWIEGNDWKVHVAATLVRQDGLEQAAPTADAYFHVEAPAFTLMKADTTAVQVGQYVQTQGDVELSFGTVLNLPTSAGIQALATDTYKASAPTDYDGYISATQLVQSNTTESPNPQSSESPPPPPQNTGSQYWLDTCNLFTTEPNGDPGTNRNLYIGAAQPVVYETVDAPNEGLLGQSLDSQIENDSFIDDFMWRPTGPDAIWVGFGQLTWFWSGTASRTGNPNVNGGWVLATSSNSSSPVVGTHEAGTMPSWPHVYNPDSGTCAPLPIK